MKAAIILCNGEPVRKKIFEKIQKRFNADLICADGGANSAYKMKLLPKVIIGDLDSIKVEVAQYYKQKKVKIVGIKRQNDTDLEKALKFCKKQKYEMIFIMGFSGRRFDHTLSNISNALKFARNFQIRLIENFSTLYLLHGKNTFHSFAGEIISMIAFRNQAKVTTHNLKYPLKSESLVFGERESTSNVSLGNWFDVEVSSHFLILTRETKSFLRYG